jgi:enolase
MKITKIHAREILDSRGNPTVEVDLYLDDEVMGRAIVPSGASTGKYEALELRDGGDRYMGKGVRGAVENVNKKIADMLVGEEDLSQEDLDQKMIDLDGTENKSELGANAILGVSLAYAWAVSKYQKRPLYEYIGELYGNTEYKLPRPMLNIMNGGKHANWATDIQEYMILPMKDITWAEKMQMACEIYHNLGKLIKGKGLSTNVGNEGGFAPALDSNKEALDLVVEAVEKAGYGVGDDVKFGFDAAATEFYDEEKELYVLKKEGKELTSEEFNDWLIKEIYEQYPIESFEDMQAEDDWDAWVDFTDRIGDEVQIVGDDLLVTNPERIKTAIEKEACNALLVKLNQIGSLTEALESMRVSKDAGWNNVVSHRSGETEDVTISHLVVGTGAGQIKTGAPSRTDRTAKYNELTRIAEEVEK